jgi:Zn-dependent membrane protease YugP
MAEMTEAVWLLLLLPLLVSLGVQQLLRTTFRRYRAVRNHAGLTGAQTARALLDAHDLRRVAIQAVPGFLTDNYDGDRKMLSLSRSVAVEPRVSALGIAAHEVAHAYQDAEGDRARAERQEESLSSAGGRRHPAVGAVTRGRYATAASRRAADEARRRQTAKWGTFAP